MYQSKSQLFPGFLLDVYEPSQLLGWVEPHSCTFGTKVLLCNVMQRYVRNDHRQFCCISPTSEWSSSHVLFYQSMYVTFNTKHRPFKVNNPRINDHRQDRRRTISSHPALQLPNEHSPPVCYNFYCHVQFPIKAACAVYWGTLTQLSSLYWMSYSNSTLPTRQSKQ